MVVSLTKYDKTKLFNEFVAYLEGRSEGLPLKRDLIPISIFSENLSPFESLTKYLVFGVTSNLLI